MKRIKKVVEMSRSNDYTVGNLLDYLWYQKHYKLFVIDLSRQKNTVVPQQINFKWKLEEDNSAIMFLIAENQERTILKLFFRFINWNMIIW